jgi:hypothetical protein
MNRFLIVPTVFLALGALFLLLTLNDARRHGLTATPAGKAWLRIGVIFGAIGAYLLLSQWRRLFHDG